MKRLALVAPLLVLAASTLAQAPPTAGASPTAPATAFWERVRASIELHIGKPYVWGATGEKSFDCSGFVWRVMTDSGLFIKRTTARKLAMCLPRPEKGQEWRFGNVVFFDDLKHCGIVNSRGSFYHAALTEGTHLSILGPFWRPQVCGVRAMPVPEGTAAASTGVAAPEPAKEVQ